MLRQLERDQYDGSDSKVYLASYIGKYGRFLGVNEASIQVELDRIRQSEPQLVATGGISHSRFLLDRYATAATYVILTGSDRGADGLAGRSRNTRSRSEPSCRRSMLRQWPVDTAGATRSRLATGRAVTSVRTSTRWSCSQDQPLMASMAPFPEHGLGGNLVVIQARRAAVPDALLRRCTGSGAHSLNLSSRAHSWVEVLDTGWQAAGIRPAARWQQQAYHSDKPLDVRIGNATGAQVTIDGQPQQLDDFRHANVAHFRVQYRTARPLPPSLITALSALRRSGPFRLCLRHCPDGGVVSRTVDLSFIDCAGPRPIASGARSF